MGDKKYLIVMPQKSFGKRFDHFNHSENNLQPYSHQQIFFLESEISKLEISIFGFTEFLWNFSRSINRYNAFFKVLDTLFHIK